jgi:hypothetical protein
MGRRCFGALILLLALDGCDPTKRGQFEVTGGGTVTPVDTSALAVSGTSPARDSTGLPPSGASISATFDDQLACGTVTIASFKLARVADGTPVIGLVTCADTIATFAPAGSLKALADYVATLTTAIKDNAGNPLTAAYQWQFTTGPDSTPPLLLSFAPAANSTQVALQPTITATFNDDLDCATLVSDPANHSFYVSDLTNVPGSTITCSGSTATIVPIAPLAPFTTYVVGLSRAIHDASGNAFAGFAWQFTTGNGTINGSLTFAPTPGFTAPPALATDFTPNRPVVHSDANCFLPSSGRLEICTMVAWFEQQTGPAGYEKIFTIWFEPVTGEVSQLDYQYQPVADSWWSWNIRALVGSPISGAVIDGPGGHATFTNTQMATGDRPPGVTDPAGMIVNGILTYP